MDSLYRGNVKIFSDGADKESILKLNKNPIVKGMTTNPSLMKKAGVTDYKAFSLSILEEVTQKPLSFEVFADELPEMNRQAKEINSWGKNVYVKIPITNSKGESTLSLVRDLSQSGVKINVTAIFSMKQTVETIRALEGGAPSIVSVFAGRIADTGRDPVAQMQASAEFCKIMGPNIELLWASCREVYNIVQADLCGCHIITCPPNIIANLSNLNKDLEAYSLETVNDFKRDATQAGFSL